MPPEMGPSAKTRMEIMVPNTIATSSSRATLMPPSCVNTTQPMVQKRKRKQPMYSAVTACRNSVVCSGPKGERESAAGGSGRAR